MDRHRFMQRRRNPASCGASDPAQPGKQPASRRRDTAGGGFHYSSRSKGGAAPSSASLSMLGACLQPTIHGRCTPHQEEKRLLRRVQRLHASPAGRVSLQLQSPHPVFACVSLTGFQAGFRSGLARRLQLAVGNLGSSWMDEVLLDACMHVD